MGKISMSRSDRHATTSSPAMSTLYDVPPGHSATIVGSDIDALFARRLRELGLREGTTVHVAQNAAGGGRIVKVLDARYALDAFTLKHIAISTSS
ncbi:ferrous iron transport protein A [Corynebacterium kroppenstedtii]|uniref:FeoA family protein n=1 Tax=Corynebacterium kroppenstedtii TaxID=161879 RepID=UPI003872F4F1